MKKYQYEDSEFGTIILYLFGVKNIYMYRKFSI